MADHPCMVPSEWEGCQDGRAEDLLNHATKNRRRLGISLDCGVCLFRKAKDSQVANTQYLSKKTEGTRRRRAM